MSQILMANSVNFPLGKLAGTSGVQYHASHIEANLYTE